MADCSQVIRPWLLKISTANHATLLRNWMLKIGLHGDFHPYIYSRGDQSHTLNSKYGNVCTTPVPYDMNTIYEPKNLESVTRITENELIICLCAFSVALRQSQHRYVVRCSGALSLKKNYLFWISANQKRDHPGGSRSDWLSSTKETQRFPESRPSLHFHFFRSRDSDPGYGNYCLWLNRQIWDQWWIYNWELVCAIEAKTVVVVVALNRSASRNLFRLLALMQVKLPQDPFPQK